MNDYIDPAHVDDLVRITGRLHARNTRLAVALKECQQVLQWHVIPLMNTMGETLYGHTALSTPVTKAENTARKLLAELEVTP